MDAPVGNWGYADGIDPERFMFNRRAQLLNDRNFGTNTTGLFPGNTPVSNPAASGQPFVSSGNQPGANPGTAPNPRRLAVNQTLNDAFGFAVQQAQNPTTSITATPRSLTQQKNVQGLQGSFDQSKPAKQQSLTEFTREFLASRPGAKQALNQETQSINRVFESGPGSFEYDLDRNRRQQDAAVNMAAQRAMEQARLQNNIARMTSGNNSYLDRAYADAVAQIMVNQALQSGQLDRQNLMDVQNLRQNNLGRRADLTRGFVNDSLLPYTVNNQLMLQDADVIRTLGEMDRSNTIYDVLTPEQQVAQRMGIVDSVMDLDEMMRLGGYV